MHYDVPLELDTFDDGGCHIVIQVKFNEKLSGRLVLDTGASKTVFDSILLGEIIEKKTSANKETSSENVFFENLEDSEQEENESNEQNLSTIGVSPGKIDTFFGTISKLQISELELTDFESVFIDLSNVNNAYEIMNKQKVWGLLGSDFLLKYRAIVNYQEMKLRLHLSQ